MIKSGLVVLCPGNNECAGYFGFLYIWQGYFLRQCRLFGENQDRNNTNQEFNDFSRGGSEGSFRV